MTPDDVIAQARALVGTPFLHQGRNPALGLDCVGLVVEALQRAGWRSLSEALPCEYSRRPKPHVLKAALNSEASQVMIEDVRTADIALMDLGEGPQHLALVVIEPDGINLIHSCDGHGVVEHRFSTEWRHRVAGFYRVKAFCTTPDLD